MAEFYDERDELNETGGEARGSNVPIINGGLLDPRTFPAYLGGGVTASPVESVMPPFRANDPEVEADIRKAQAALTPEDYWQIARQVSQITGPLRTSLNTNALQNMLAAQAGLAPVKPQPETWSVNRQPYRAISADDFDPARSNGVTSMPTPQDSAAAFAGRSIVTVPRGEDDERAGYIDRSPPRVVRSVGKAGHSDTADTYTYARPSGLPLIHGHIDGTSEGMVDQPKADNLPEAYKGYGDTWSFTLNPPVPTATVSHNQVGWHILDNGQLKFLYPAGSMTPFQIRNMQGNLNQEQQKFLRPR